MVAGPEVDNGQASGLEAQYNRYNRYVHEAKHEAHRLLSQTAGYKTQYRPSSDTTHEDRKCEAEKPSRHGRNKTHEAIWLDEKDS